MKVPQMKLGPVLVTAPDMPARILRERNAELRAYLEIGELELEKRPPEADQVRAIAVLVRELAAVQKLELTLEEVESLITTRNLGEAVLFVGWAYFAPPDTSGQGEAPGEAGSPSTSTSTGSSGT